MTVPRGTIVLLLAAFAIPASARADADRVMIGDDIYVGANEDIGDAVCIGCSIRVDGKVRDAVAIGGSIVINGEAADTVSIGGSVEIAGAAKDAVSIGGGLAISGAVDGDAVSVLGGVRLASGARIAHDVVAVLGSIDGLRGADVGGSVHQSGSGNVRPVALSGIVVFIVLMVIVALAFWPIVTWITIMVLGPRRVSVLRETVSERAGMSLLLGFGAWVASIVLPIVLFWLPPAELLVGLAFMVLAAIGYAGVSYWVGGAFIKSRSIGATGVLGAILITIIQFIPVVGWFIATPFFGFLALGAAVLSGFGTSPDWMIQRSEADPIPRPALR